MTEQIENMRKEFMKKRDEQLKSKTGQLTLNDIASVSYANAKKRQANGGHISVETRNMLKHCATEVVEAMEAYANYEDRLHFVELSKAGLEIDDNRKTNVMKSKFAYELADIICCCTIIAGRENIDLNKAVADCLEKNRKRAEGIGDKL